MAQHHVLQSSPDTVHWGYFDARLPPVLTIASGDTVEIACVSGGPEVLKPGLAVLAEHQSIIDRLSPQVGPHILTGPIAVADAAPGDLLAVEILDVALRQDWGWSLIKPGLGTLPEDFPHARLWHSRIDGTAMAATLPWGATIPLRPFFGVMGVAPAAARGVLTSVEPAEFGGNIDCKELLPGATLYLPVWTAGALFSVGDGHAVQGDGEVCLTALETALSGTFRLTLHKRVGATLPRFATPTEVGTFGFDRDLDEAARIALRAMIALITAETSLPPEEAYLLCSLAADLRVTQLVDGNKGVHVLLDRRWLD